LNEMDPRKKRGRVQSDNNDAITTKKKTPEKLSNQAERRQKKKESKNRRRENGIVKTTKEGRGEKTKRRGDRSSAVEKMYGRKPEMEKEGEKPKSSRELEWD